MLAEEEITVIQCRSMDIDYEVIGAWIWGRYVLESEGIINLPRFPVDFLDGDCFRHCGDDGIRL